MATSYRFPVLLWRDFTGWYTASLLEWAEPAGTARSASAALKQLAEYLRFRYEERPWMSEPDFFDAKLIPFKVPIRPEYQVDQRRYPEEETFLLRVHCVRGKQLHGMRICAIPTLGVRFYYYEENALKKLVPHYVQQKLEGVTPQQLSRFLPPPHVELNQVVVTLRNRPARHQPWEPHLEALPAVAEPLGEPRIRKQYTRPWEREESVRDLFGRLTREKANVILVGESGCGKTSVMVEAVRLVEREKPKEEEEDSFTSTYKRRFWRSSGSRIIAGMKYLGEWEERCEQVIDELGEINGVLCAESLLDLVRAGGQNPSESVASFLVPFLQRGELKMITEATPDELDACRRLLPGFTEVFQILKLEPFTRQQAVNVLDHVSAQLQQNLHLEVEPGVTDLIYHLYRRFVPYEAFPGRAVEFEQRVFEPARRAQRKSEDEVRVDKDRVVGEFVRRTGLPELFLRDDISLSPEEVRSTFGRQIIGQEQACQAATDLVLTFKAGLNDPARPVAALLFCGPTGVGKTALARALSRYFFGHGEERDRLIRLDMSEYSGYGAGERLLAQPNGEPSELIRKVRRQPFVVVLLDEIEKADPIVFDVLLNVLDEGRLTDRYGRVTTFRSAILIMTSNLGAGKQASFGFGQESSVAYEDEAMRFFRPEFFNRLDGVVTFQPLSHDTILSITRKELGEIEQREGLRARGLKLSWSEELVAHLAKVGFDPQYGARPLQRALETAVVTPLARWLLEHPEVREDRISVSHDKERGVGFTS